MKDHKDTDLELSEVKVDEKKASVESLKQVPQGSANSNSITKKILDADRKVKLMIPASEKEKSAVFVSVNGVAFNIPRNQWVEVPYSIVAVLENAKCTEYTVQELKGSDSAIVSATDVSRIPFQTKA